MEERTALEKEVNTVTWTISNQTLCGGYRTMLSEFLRGNEESQYESFYWG